jgi:hypothetical protein
MQGCVSLGIQVQEADAMPAGSDAGCKVHRGGRFTNPTFLIDDRNFSHTKPLPKTSSSKTQKADFYLSNRLKTP